MRIAGKKPYKPIKTKRYREVFYQVPIGKTTNELHLKVPRDKEWEILEIKLITPASVTCSLKIDDELLQDGIINTTWSLQNSTAGGFPKPLTAYDKLTVDVDNASASPQNVELIVYCLEKPYLWDITKEKFEEELKTKLEDLENLIKQVLSYVQKKA
jgi:hypothetical protein